MGGANGGYNGGADEDERVHEWEAGLPNFDDLMPFNKGLTPLGLLSAFNIKPEPNRTAGDLNRACEDTLSTIRGQPAGSNFQPFDENQEIIEEIDDEEGEAEDDGSDSKKPRRNVSPEDADSAAAMAVEEVVAADEKTLKRARLVWTPQLHKRFVDVVAHLGIKNAVPKTIMQLMNVEGLTRENVASHLQKYRLYLKRMQGVSFDGPSSSGAAAASTEQLFASSTPVLPENGNGSRSGSGSGSGSGNGNVGMIPMPYPQSQMVQMPVPMMGMGNGHMGMGMGNYNGFDSHHHNNHYNLHHHHHHHHQFNGTMQSGNKYGSVMSYHHHHPPHVTPGDK